MPNDRLPIIEQTHERCCTQKRCLKTKNVTNGYGADYIGRQQLAGSLGRACRAFGSGKCFALPTASSSVGGGSTCSKFHGEDPACLRYVLSHRSVVESAGSWYDVRQLDDRNPRVSRRRRRSIGRTGVACRDALGSNAVVDAVEAQAVEGRVTSVESKIATSDQSLALSQYESDTSSAGTEQCVACSIPAWRAFCSGK